MDAIGGGGQEGSRLVDLGFVRGSALSFPLITDQQLGDREYKHNDQ